MRSFIVQRLQVEQGAAAVIQDTEQRMKLTIGIGLAGEVYSPDEVARNIFRFDVFEVAAQDLDFIVVLLQYLVDECFADGNLT